VGAVPHLAQIDTVPENDWQPLAEAALGDGDFRHVIHDFYLTNPIARASELMAELSRDAQARGMGMAAE
jgi:NADH-quinone oxidoreductase subunit G